MYHSIRLYNHKELFLYFTGKAPNTEVNLHISVLAYNVCVHMCSCHAFGLKTCTACTRLAALNNVKVVYFFYKA